MAARRASDWAHSSVSPQRRWASSSQAGSQPVPRISARCSGVVLMRVSSSMSASTAPTIRCSLVMRASRSARWRSRCSSALVPASSRSSPMRASGMPVSR